jgi:hypothetical protein
VQNRWEDAEGNLMRADRIPAHEKSKDKLVRRLSLKALKVAKAIQELHEETAKEFVDFIEQMATEYEVKLGGKLGNVTMFTFDRRFKIERCIQKREAVNEKVSLIIETTQACADRWSKGANKNLQVVSSRYFKKDRNGNYDVKALRDLKKLPVKDDDKWAEAMALIDEAIDVVGSATYYRFSVRDDKGNYYGIPLAISDV